MNRVFKTKLLIGFFALALLIPIISESQATLWGLQIQANVENSPIISGERPIVSGLIIDHASKPVPKAEVTVKSESIVIVTSTSQSGEFQVELGKHDRIPGNYLVTISALAEDGRTGIESIQYQVRGELSPSTMSQSKLSTPEAIKYLNSSPDDFDKNPIGYMLYNYYQKLYKEYLEEQKQSEQIIQNKEKIEQQKEEEQKFREKAIEEFNPGAGVFSGPQYENYVNSLDDEVRDVVVEHLNFTKNLFYEAQSLRNEILQNGGSAEEAHKAYLEKISTSRETIENLGNNEEESQQNIQEEVISETIESQENIEEEVKSSITVDLEGTTLEVDYKESVFLVEVNGHLLKFIVTDNNIIQILTE